MEVNTNEENINNNRELSKKERQANMTIAQASEKADNRMLIHFGVGITSCFLMLLPIAAVQFGKTRKYTKSTENLEKLLHDATDEQKQLAEEITTNSIMNSNMPPNQKLGHTKFIEIQTEALRRVKDSKFSEEKQSGVENAITGIINEGKNESRFENLRKGRIRGVSNHYSADISNLRKKTRESVRSR